jgi:hypothetical protein
VADLTDRANEPRLIPTCHAGKRRQLSASTPMCAPIAKGSRARQSRRYGTGCKPLVFGRTTSARWTET